MFQKFGEEWEEKVRKLSIKQIKEMFPIRLGLDFELRVKKERLVKLLRSYLIVEEFNEKYKKGDKILWKADVFASGEEVTVKYKAFVSGSGQPMCFFEEYFGYCCVDTCFVIEEGKSDWDAYLEEVELNSIG